MVKLRLMKVLAVGLVMLMGASLAMAQEQGQRRPGGGGFGGGFGARLSGVLGLITNDAVQKDLAVDADTTAKLKKVADDANADVRAASVRGGRDVFDGLSDEERRAKFAEIQKKNEEAQAKAVAKFEPQLKEVLTEAQFTRLKQIYWQSSLSAALADPEVINGIALTKEQQDKIAAVGKEYAEKRTALMPPRGAGGGGAGGGNFQETFAKMQELAKERETKTTDVLSAEQKEKFATLKGKEFDVSKLRGGFGGGRPGGGRPAGGRPAAETEKKAE